jgi:hypothetical protein
MRFAAAGAAIEKADTALEAAEREHDKIVESIGKIAKPWTAELSRKKSDGRRQMSGWKGAA